MSALPSEFIIEEAPELAAGHALYLYAIARPRDGQASAHALIEGMLPGAPVYALQYQDVCALVSPAPLSEFSPEALETNLRDETWVRDRVLAHQRALMLLMRQYTLVPCAFCTLYHDTWRVLALLTERYAEWVGAITQVTGATEWGVKVYCNRRALAQWAESHSPELDAQRAAIARASEGAAFLLRRKLTQAAEKVADAIGAAILQTSHARMAAAVRAAEMLPTQAQEVHGRKAMMALNGAYLVDNAALEAFSEVVGQLRCEYAPHGFEYELTGPWPPYNFTTPQSKESLSDAAAVE
jgi:hypothetical protein